LTGVVGLSDLMAKTELTAKQQEFLQGIRKSSQTLLRLINDVLDMSKLEAEAMPIVAEPTNVRELIAEVVLIHRPMALEKGIDLRFLEPDRDDLTLLLDPLRLHQILHNLVGNAVKFTLEGEVTIDFHRVSPTEFELVVRDTGIGIAPDKQSTVFEAFEQADATTTRFFGGTGLGLTITQRLVQRMGGTISLASERGVGTAITVRLALEEVEPVEETIQVRPVPPGIRVLLAEDNVVNTLVITEQLKDFGCIVTHGSNGRAAVAAFGEQSFDLVLMDIQMPEMDGYQACQAIRTQFPDRPTPIFALTANAFEDERSQAKKVGMNGYLTKPIQTDEIIPVLLLAANPPPALAS